MGRTGAATRAAAAYPAPTPALQGQRWAGRLGGSGGQKLEPTRLHCRLEQARCYQRCTRSCQAPPHSIPPSCPTKQPPTHLLAAERAGLQLLEKFHVQQVKAVLGVAVEHLVGQEEAGKGRLEQQLDWLGTVSRVGRCSACTESWRIAKQQHCPAAQRHACRTRGTCHALPSTPSGAWRRCARPTASSATARRAPSRESASFSLARQK